MKLSFRDILAQQYHNFKTLSLPPIITSVLWGEGPAFLSFDDVERKYVKTKFDLLDFFDSPFVSFILVVEHFLLKDTHKI